LEQKKESNGFSIVNAKIPILIVLKRVQELKPHEQIVESDLQGIVAALKKDPVLRHPIIADSNSGAVLDGTHRLEALKRLGSFTIPTALIDYQNPLVIIDRWFRIISGTTLKEFTLRIQQLTPHGVEAKVADQSLLSRSCYASLRDRTACFSFRSKDNSPLSLYQEASKLEQAARDMPLKIAYTDSEDIIDLPTSSFVMSTIRLRKEEVVESSQHHHLFPPKSTRHLIPSRPLGLGIPLRILNNANLQEAEFEFEQYIRSKKITRKPEGSWIGSRRYMEEVFLFE
jgi:L-serine kinase (ADP)